MSFILVGPRKAGNHAARAFLQTCGCVSKSNFLERGWITENWMENYEKKHADNLRTLEEMVADLKANPDPYNFTSGHAEVFPREDLKTVFIWRDVREMAVSFFRRKTNENRIYQNRKQFTKFVHKNDAFYDQVIWHEPWFEEDNVFFISFNDLIKGHGQKELAEFLGIQYIPHDFSAPQVLGSFTGRLSVWAEWHVKTKKVDLEKVLIQRYMDKGGDSRNITGRKRSYTLTSR